MNKAQLKAIYTQLYRKPPHRSLTVAQLKEAILIDEDEVADEPDHGQEKKTKRKLADRVDEAQRQLVALQGRSTQGHDVYDLFNDSYNLVDRMDQEHYAYFHHCFNRHSNEYGLLCAATYMMANCRAVWEEHRREHAHGRAGHNNRVVAEMESFSTPHFVVQVIKQYVAQHPE